MTTKRARVTFADKKNAPTLGGSTLTRAEGDYEEATGILWNVKKGSGVVATQAKDHPIGVHLPTGNLIQFIPEGAIVPTRTPQEIVDELEGVEDPEDRAGPVDEPEVAAAPPPRPVRQPDPRAVPVTEAAKKAEAARQAKIAAARGQPAEQAK
jgi:hypothetical protein